MAKTKQKPPNAVLAWRIANTYGFDIPEEKLAEFAKENGYKPAVFVRNYKEYVEMVNKFKSI